MKGRVDKSRGIEILMSVPDPCNPGTRYFLFIYLFILVGVSPVLLSVTKNKLSV